MRNLVLIVIISVSSSVSCQDFSLIWEMNPSLLGQPYQVKVFRCDSKSRIEILNTNLGKSTRRNCLESDWDSLYNFFNTYYFKSRAEGRRNQILSRRKYFYSEPLTGTRKVVVNNDTIAESLLSHYGYFWGLDSNKYYRDPRGKVALCLDGTAYFGEFVTRGESQLFKFHCFLEPQDYELNSLIFDIICNYAKRSEINQIEFHINIENPDN